METSTPMGTLDMIPAETLVACELFLCGYLVGGLIILGVVDIDDMVGSGEELYAACMS